MKNIKDVGGSGPAADRVHNITRFNTDDIVTKTSGKQDNLTQEVLMDILHYDPDSGIFTRKISRRRCKPNKIAGSLGTCGYISIGIRGTTYYAHRLAWLYVHGEFPCLGKYIDHINHNSADNRIANLRIVTHSQNARNARLSKCSTSGHLGVCWRKNGAKWEAHIRVNNIRRHLGRFTNIADAVQARKSADLKYGFHANHGSVL